MNINDVLLVSFIALLVIYLSYKWIFGTKKNNFPPGPKGLPVIGSLTDLTPRLALALERFRKQYGPVYTLKLGIQKVVVISSCESIKEAFVTSNNFHGRSQDALLSVFSREQGIFFSDGEKWKRQKKTATKILRNFGIGRQMSREIIQLEIEDLKGLINLRAGRPINPLEIFPKATARVIHSLALNEKPAYDDAKFEKCIDDLRLVFSSLVAHFLPLFIPFALKVPFVYQLCMMFTNAGKIKEVQNYFGTKVKEHMKSFNSQEEPRDYIDAMLATQDEARKEPGYTDELFQHRVRMSIFELFADGTDTVAAVLIWAFFLLALHPDEQDKVQNEINTNCDKNFPIKFEDKKSLPYTCAFVDEVMRFGSVAPIGLEHRATADCKIGDFDIPKDTLVLPNFYSAHRDPKHWERPDEFYVNHFLTADGHSYQPREQLIPFSVGPRSCLGESLASMEIFLITASLIRDYNVKLLGNYSEAEIQTFLMGNDGLTRCLSPHELQFNRRL